jgi:hypothetical protein
MGRERQKPGASNATGATVKTRTIRADGRIKSAYWLEGDLRRQLRLVAAEQGTDAGKVIAEALRGHLPKFNVIKGLRREIAAAQKTEATVGESENNGAPIGAGDRCDVSTEVGQ